MLPQGLQQELSARLQLSVHYASTPALNRGANSVEDSSVNSEDCSEELKESSPSPPSMRPSATLYISGAHSTVSYGKEPPPYLSSAQSTASSSAYSGSVEAPSPPRRNLSAVVSVRNPSHAVKSRTLQQQRVASVSSSRLSALIRQTHELSLASQEPQSLPLSQQKQPVPVRQPMVTVPNFPPPPPPPPPPPEEEEMKEDVAKKPIQDLTVTDVDVAAIDACYRGHKTRVYVCGSLANLYTTPRLVPGTTSAASASGPTPWTLRLTGIPVLLLDTGSTRARTRRRIQILLVEKGSCFTLWRDVVDNLSRYTAQDPMFHVMYVSTDHASRIGFSFDSERSAEDFLNCVKMLTSDPANISLNGPAVSAKMRRRLEAEARETVRAYRRYRPPPKAEISLPCGFQHVIKVTREDMDKYFSTQAYVEHCRKEDKSGSNRSTGTKNNNKTLNRRSAVLERGSTGKQLTAFSSCSELNC